MGDTEALTYVLEVVDSLSEHPRNPHKGEIPAIRQSIRHNGFYGAVVAQARTGFILAGNHRWRAARAEGITEIPVVWLDIDDETALRIMIGDNRLSALGATNEAALETVLEALEMTGLDGTGYDEIALDAIAQETYDFEDAESTEYGYVVCESREEQQQVLDVLKEAGISGYRAQRKI